MTRQWLAALLVVLAGAGTLAQTPPGPVITTPREQFGYDVGADYRLVNYTQYVEYLQ